MLKVAPSLLSRPCQRSGPGDLHMAKVLQSAGQAIIHSPASGLWTKIVKTRGEDAQTMPRQSM